MWKRNKTAARIGDEENLIYAWQASPLQPLSVGEGERKTLGVRLQFQLAGLACPKTHS